MGVPYSQSCQCSLWTPQTGFFFWYFLVSSSTFPPSFALKLFLHCSGMCWVMAPSLSLVTAAFPSHLYQFLCTPHAELVVRGGAKLEGSSGEATEFAAIALGDQTYVMNILNTYCCLWSEERKAPIVFLPCSQLSQWYFCSLCFFCLKLHNSQEVSSYKRLLSK